MLNHHILFTSIKLEISDLVPTEDYSQESPGTGCSLETKMGKFITAFRIARHNWKKHHFNFWDVHTYFVICIISSAYFCNLLQTTEILWILFHCAEF